MKESLTLAQLIAEAYQTAKDHGFHDEAPHVPTLLALLHSEVSEALEDYREGNVGLGFLDSSGVVHDCQASEQEQQGGMPLRKPVGLDSELADVLIRLCDMAGALAVDLERATIEKLRYNKSRSHKHGGKRC